MYPLKWSYFSTICLILYTAEKTKTAVDYLDSRQISGQAEAPKACFLFPWSTREWSLTYGHSPSNPRLFLYPYIPQPWRGICQGLYWPPEGRQEETPPLLLAESFAEAQHCTANAKAGNSIRAHTTHRQDRQSKELSWQLRQQAKSSHTVTKMCADLSIGPKKKKIPQYRFLKGEFLKTVHKWSLSDILVCCHFCSVS